VARRAAGARELIAQSGLPRHEAERLLRHATGWPSARLASEDDVPADAAEAFVGLTRRRRAGEPLQYLERTVQFGPLTLRSDARALIPRPETEQLWERVVERVGPDMPAVIVDLCTGSGNLALALKRAFPAATVYGTDESPDALALATENGALTGLDVEWRHGDLFAALPDAIRGRVDVLVANPPYLAEDELAALPVDVRDHEPVAALVAGPAGDEVLERIAAESDAWLSPGGFIASEISEFQADRVTHLFARYDGVVERDLAGRPRFVFGAR
jgi:release factor glutamine methyltransferase